MSKNRRKLRKPEEIQFQVQFDCFFLNMTGPAQVQGMYSKVERQFLVLISEHVTSDKKGFVKHTISRCAECVSV